MFATSAQAYPFQLPAVPDQGELLGPFPPGTPEQLPRMRARRLSLSLDRRLFYYEAGTATGPVALFIHGIGGWAENWLPSLAPFEHFRCLIPDLPGFGRSSAPERRTYQGLIADLLALLEAEGVEQCILVGNSLGGGMALRMALDQPKHFTHLVLATAAGIQKDIALPFRVGLLPGLGELALSHFGPVFRARWKVQFGNTELCTPQFLDALARFSERHNCRDTYLGVLRHGSDFSGLLDVVTDELPQLRQPTLLCWGTADRVLSPRHALYASRVMPKVSVEFFEGAGHYPHWEQPGHFNRLVREHLERWGF
ncbi:MAG: alpha/beta fold hydrolase [Myxococcota bacterium]